MKPEKLITVFPDSKRLQGFCTSNCVFFFFFFFCPNTEARCLIKHLILITGLIPLCWESYRRTENSAFWWKHWMLLLFVLNEAFCKWIQKIIHKKNLVPAAMVCNFHGSMLQLSGELQQHSGGWLRFDFSSFQWQVNCMCFERWHVPSKHVWTKWLAGLRPLWSERRCLTTNAVVGNEVHVGWTRKYKHVTFYWCTAFPTFSARL